MERSRLIVANRGAQRGLTLVETLVALAILSAVALSSYAVLSQATRFMAREQERALAGVIADNILIEALVREAAPDRGVEEGEQELAGRRFLWRRTVTEAGEDYVNVEVTIALPPAKQAIARVAAIRSVS
jgi:general secretion pathway protein I